VPYKKIFILLLLSLPLLAPVSACKCKLPEISFGYNLSTVIFYGKHLGTVADNNLQLMGVPQKLEQFEVISVFKGYTSMVNQTLQQMKQEGKGGLQLSLGSTCSSSCGFCFDSGAYYLVYAHLDYPYILQTSACSRTRKISQENFIIANASDPSNGNNELKALVQLAQTDTTSGKPLDLVYQEKINEMSSQLKKKNSMTIILSTSTLILLFYVALGFFGRKKRA